jgi:hypothetical protein
MELQRISMEAMRTEFTLLWAKDLHPLCSAKYVRVPIYLIAAPMQ